MASEAKRVRMSGPERREQLLQVGRASFAEHGYEAASVEEIARRAGVTKPILYEHFGGKEGLYAVIVDRELRSLGERVRTALSGGSSRERLERAVDVFLRYIEEEPDGFRVLVRDVPSVTGAGGSFGSLIHDIANEVETLLGREFGERGFDRKLAWVYSRSIVGQIAMVGQYWLEVRKPKRQVVAAHLVNVAWNGLSGIVPKPTLTKS